MKKLISWMERVTLLVSIFIMFGVKASASPLSDLWTDIKSQSDLHLGDNVQPAVFYNMRHGVPATKRLSDGVLTTIYTYRQLDLNFGGLQGLNSGTPFVPVASVGIRIDKYLAKGFAWVPPLLGEPANSDIFKRIKTGPYFSYDFRDRSKSYGAAFAVNFGGSAE